MSRVAFTILPILSNRQLKCYFQACCGVAQPQHWRWAQHLPNAEGPTLGKPSPSYLLTCPAQGFCTHFTPTEQLCTEASLSLLWAHFSVQKMTTGPRREGTISQVRGQEHFETQNACKTLIFWVQQRHLEMWGDDTSDCMWVSSKGMMEGSMDLSEICSSIQSCVNRLLREFDVLMIISLGKVKQTLIHVFKMLSLPINKLFFS